MNQPMKREPDYAILAIALLLGLIGVVLWVGRADAHTPAVTSKCNTLTVHLTDYDRGSMVVVKIGEWQETTRFNRDFTKTYSGTGPWSVIVDNSGKGYDGEWNGNLASCTPATTTTVCSSNFTQSSHPCATTTTRVLPDIVEPTPPTTTVVVLDAPAVISTQAVALEVPVPPTVLAFTGPNRSELFAIIGFCLLGSGGTMYLASRRRTVR